jgi:hypothetical protein
MVNEEDLDKAAQEFESDMIKGLEVAKANNMNLTKFKDEIKQGLLTANDEDQWTFDYESFLFSISNGIYEEPKEWAKEHYMDRWSDTTANY